VAEGRGGSHFPDFPDFPDFLDFLDFNRRYRLDLDQRTVMHLLYRDDRPRRAVLAKNASVNVVDRPPKIAVGNIDRHLDNMVEIAPGRLQNPLDISDRLLGLGLDTALDNLARVRVGRQLTRDENKTVVNNG